jgi:hypothetical protein
MSTRESGTEVPLLSAERVSSESGESVVGPQRYGATTTKDAVVIDISQTDSEDGYITDAEEGVQQADAINLVWSRSALIWAYSLSVVSMIIRRWLN